MIALGIACSLAFALFAVMLITWPDDRDLR